MDAVNLETPQLKVYSFARLVFRLCSSPFLLNAIISHHITNHFVASQFAEEILRSLYVDDYVGGADGEEAVLERQRLLKSGFKDDGLNMRKWSIDSNVVKEKSIKSKVSFQLPKHSQLCKSWKKIELMQIPCSIQLQRRPKGTRN